TASTPSRERSLIFASPGRTRLPVDRQAPARAAPSPRVGAGRARFPLRGAVVTCAVWHESLRPKGGREARWFARICAPGTARAPRHQEQRMPELDRRRFLQVAGGGTAMSVLTPSIARAASIPAYRRAGSLDDVEHVVVLMQENRSFD